jgi:hypothetical protein
MDLGKWLKNRKDQAVRQWQDSVILDAVSSNTKADQARRATQGTPLTVRQQASNTYGGGFSAPVNRVKDIFSADTEADFIKRKAVTGLFEDYNTQQNRQNEIAKNDPTQRSGIRQFGNNLYGGVMEFGGKAPGAILDAKASYDRSTIGKVNNYVSPLTQGQALLGLAQDKLRGDALGTNYDQRTKAMQDFGVAQQDLVQNKVDQSRFGQRTADNKWLAGSGRALGNVGGQVALTVASGGSTLPGALVSGAQTFSQQRQEAMDAGKSESYATNVGALQGGVQAVTEKIGLDKLKFPGGSNFVINTLKRFGTEGAQEGGQQFAQNLITNKTYNPNQGLKEGVLESAILGGFAGGTAGAVFDIPGAIPQTGIPAQPGGIRERIQIAKENVNSVINGSPDALPPNQVVRNPAVFDAVMDKMKQLENPDAYTTAELNEMNQVLFDASKETGIPFLQGSREQQRQTLAQFQEMNGEALQNPQTTLRDRIRSAKDKIKPLGEKGSAPGDSPIMPLNKLIPESKGEVVGIKDQRADIDKLWQKRGKIRQKYEAEFAKKIKGKSEAEIETIKQDLLAKANKATAPIDKQLDQADIALENSIKSEKIDTQTSKTVADLVKNSISQNTYDPKNIGHFIDLTSKNLKKVKPLEGIYQYGKLSKDDNIVMYAKLGEGIAELKVQQWHEGEKQIYRISNGNGNQIAFFKNKQEALEFAKRALTVEAVAQQQGNRVILSGSKVDAPTTTALTTAKQPIGEVAQQPKTVAPTTKKFTPISQPVDSTPAIVKQVTKMQSSNKQVSKDRYSIANSDIARTKSTGMNQDGFTVEDWGGKKRYVSLDDASPETKMKVRKAEAEYEAAKKANNGTALAAKQKVNDAYSDAINDLNLQDYATTDSGTRTFNSRYNDWLETKYKDRNVDTATIKDMAANPQKYRQQFEAETSQPIGEVAQQPKTVAPVESKTKEGAILSTIKEKPNKLKRTWYRGVNDYNQAKDIYSSSDKGVAEDYGAVRKLTQAELPKNPLLIDGGKENFMTEIGYNEAKWGHPTAESVGQPSSETYDTLIKKYALKNGYDGVVYDYGSGEVPELVVYNKPETKKPFTPISQPVDNTPAIVKQVTKAKTPKATPVDAKSYAKVFDTTEAEAKAQLNKPATVSVRGNDTNKLLEKMKTDKKINDAVAEAQASGKELNFFAKKDANDRSVGIEQFNPKYHRIEAGFVVDEDGNMLGNHIKVDETGIQVNVGGKVINTEAVIGNPLDWGSKGKIDKTLKGRYKFSETMNRNIDNNAPTPEIANQTKTFLWSNKVKAESNMRTELQQEFTNLNDRIKKTNKARPSNVSKEQYKADIFATLNGDKTDAEIRKEYDAKPAEAILTYKKETRKLYDSLLTRINAERVKFGQEAITPRKDYITHLQEMNQQKGFVSEVYGTMKNSFADEGMGKTRSGVPGDIAGRTEGFKPISRYNPFLQRRTGTDSLKDPFMAVQEYLQPALYNIHMTEPAARARAIEAAFRTAEHIRNLDSKAVATEMETTLEKYKNKSSDNSKLITGFQEYANALAGKTQRLDRQVIDTSDGTAKALKGWQGLQRIGGRGTILGNLSSVLAQPLNQVVGFADAGGINYAKGIAEYMGGNSEIDKSDFIRARETEAAKPLRGTGEKINDAGAIPLQAAELASVKLLWHTQHQKALGAGYKGQEAIQQADINTERLVAGRGIADKPEAYRSTVTNGLLQYTLEVNAQNKAFWQDLNTSQKVKFMVAATATNTLMAAITGYEPLPDFLKAIFETGKDFLDEEDDRNSLQKGFGGIQRMTSEYVGMNPLVGSAVNVLPQDARKKLFGSESEVGRYPGGNAPIQVVTNTIDAANKITKGDYKGAAESAIRNVPFGNQIRKTAGGIELINKGYATDSNGDPTYQAPTSTLGKAQVLAFGPNASKNAQNYYNEKEAGLTKDDLERLRDTPPEKREEYKQQLIAKNKASDKAKTDKEKRLKDSGSTTSKVNAINTASQDKLDALKASLSPDDYDISNMTKAEKKQVVESGIKTQSEMDGLDNYVKNKKKELGIATSEAKDLPNNINQKARQILEDENVSDAEWLKKPNTDTELSSTVASWLPKGITAPPVNNATAKSWAELEKKRAEGTLGKLEEESTKKTILRNAYNSVLTEDEKDLYSLSEDNLIDAYDRGVINDENINKALAVEKQLFDTGLISKETLANKLGLVARGYKGRSGGRGGRGSTAKDTSRTEINNLSLDTFSKLNQLLAGTTAKKSAPKRVVAQKAVTKKITVKA